MIISVEDFGKLLEKYPNFKLRNGNFGDGGCGCPLTLLSIDKGLYGGCSEYVMIEKLQEKMCVTNHNMWEFIHGFDDDICLSDNPYYLNGWEIREKYLPHN